MSAKNIIATVTGFLSHHINDLNNLAGALGEITSVLPMDNQDKDRIGEVISAIKTSADNIANFLENTNVTGGGDVTLKESDIVEALGNFFNSPEGQTVLKSIVGNVDA